MLTLIAPSGVPDAILTHYLNLYRERSALYEVRLCGLVIGDRRTYVTAYIRCKETCLKTRDYITYYVPTNTYDIAKE